jgi:hypothetical protein
VEVVEISEIEEVEVGAGAEKMEMPGVSSVALL